MCARKFQKLHGFACSDAVLDARVKGRLENRNNEEQGKGREKMEKS